jgi:sulfatase modifying factor 1
VTISDRRSPRSWRVHVESYLLDACPITQATYDAVAGRGPCDAQAAQRPAETVSWFDAIQFCNALSEREGLTPAYDVRTPAADVKWDVEADGYRLPSEAE